MRTKLQERYTMKIIADDTCGFALCTILKPGIRLVITEDDTRVCHTK